MLGAGRVHAIWVQLQRAKGFATVLQLPLNAVAAVEEEDVPHLVAHDFLQHEPLRRVAAAAAAAAAAILRPHNTIAKQRAARRQRHRCVHNLQHALETQTRAICWSSPPAPR